MSCSLPSARPCLPAGVAGQTTCPGCCNVVGKVLEMRPGSVPPGLHGHLQQRELEELERTGDAGAKLVAKMRQIMEEETRRKAWPWLNVQLAHGSQFPSADNRHVLIAL
jgi:hypothetical protein